MMVDSYRIFEVIGNDGDMFFIQWIRAGSRKPPYVQAVTADKLRELQAEYFEFVPTKGESK